jgi:hypothetical protein
MKINDGNYQTMKGKNGYIRKNIYDIENGVNSYPCFVGIAVNAGVWNKEDDEYGKEHDGAKCESEQDIEFAGVWQHLCQVVIFNILYTESVADSIQNEDEGNRRIEFEHPFECDPSGRNHFYWVSHIRDDHENSECKHGNTHHLYICAAVDDG